MAGYNDNIYFDPSFELDQDRRNCQYSEYNLNRKAQMRDEFSQAPFLSSGRQPTFYGPKEGKRVTRESFLQGRGHVLDYGPACGVTTLPEELFPSTKSNQKVCEYVDLESLYTRLPRSCNGLNEIDISRYWMMPENFKRGYQGFNLPVYANNQSRVGPLPRGRSPNVCNYGSYQQQRIMGPYH